MKTSAAVELVRERQPERTQAVASEPKTPFANPMLAHKAISEFEFENFQVALVPFPRYDATATTLREGNGGSRMVVLPMTWKQLVSRVRREVVAIPAEPQTSLVCFGDVSVDLRSIEVRRSNQVVPMTAMEFKVLKFFLMNPNRVITRDDLLDQVWGYNDYPSTRTVDNHILRLRHKLEPEWTNPVHFRTVHGLGYKFTP